jgi:hypothetical protein
VFLQHVGTKNLIRKHQTVLTRLLWEVANAPEDVLPLEKRLEFFTVSTSHPCVRQRNM